ncbi:MAG: hypothetical protein QNJ37_24095 [Crocosphaera sp.]|nr:hypothetical protein [Crocosphaera sp.]
MSKTVALWTAPRSCSNAFLKTFSQRKDTAILHEPFGDIYYFSKWRRSNILGDDQTRLNINKQTVINRIKSKIAPLVFFKDFAYEALPYDIDQSFLNCCTNTFLIRNPQEVIDSWYRVGAYYPTEEELGFVALERMWNIVTKELKQKPILVEANRFRQEPAKILKSYCQQIGVEFEPTMLEWDDSTITQGHSHPPEFHQQWRKTLHSSKTILPPNNIEVKIRVEDREMIERAMIIYQKLSPFAL